MLYAISRGYVPGYQDGQGPVVHLVSDVQAVESAGHRFVLADGHAAMAFTQFFDDLTRLDQIDWAVMPGRYWNDTPQYPDRKRRRQAECLVHRFFPWSLVTAIGVHSGEMKRRVEAACWFADHVPPITVRPDWYY
jgi:hypothetical protein